MLDIEKQRQVLLDRRAELETKTKAIEAELRQAHAASFAEQAVEREADEVLQGLEEKNVAEVRLIDAALARIEAGDYGECRACGEEIDERRLASLPQTPFCAACADKAG